VSIHAKASAARAASFKSASRRSHPAAPSRSLRVYAARRMYTCFELIDFTKHRICRSTVLRGAHSQNDEFGRYRVISEPAKLWTASIGEVEVCHVPHVQQIVYILLFHVPFFFVYQCHVQNFSDSCTVFGFILTSRPTSTMIC